MGPGYGQMHQNGYKNTGDNKRFYQGVKVLFTRVFCRIDNVLDVRKSDLAVEFPP